MSVDLEYYGVGWNVSLIYSERWGSLSIDG